MVNWEKVAQAAVAAYLLITFALALYLLCKVWPGAPVSAECVSKDPCQPSPFWIFNHEVRLTLELRQILVGIFAGMIGNLIASLLSFASYAGNQKLVASWLPWYVLNPFVGTGIAVLFYFVYRAGLVTSGSESFAINTYGIAAIAGLAGMFSKNAADKLKDVFDVAFQSKQDKQRKDKLTSPPVITGIQPPTLAKGTKGAAVTISGSGFVSGSVAQVNGEDRPTAFVSSSSLTVQLTESDLAQAALLTVAVKNPDGTTSPELTAEVK